MKSNFKFGQVINLSAQVDYSEEKVAFTPIFDTTNGGVVLLAFKKGQKLDKHLATAEVMVNVLEGEVEFTMNDNVHTIGSGEILLMGAEVPQSVKAKKDSKIMLVKIKNL